MIIAAAERRLRVGGSGKVEGGPEGQVRHQPPSGAIAADQKKLTGESYQRRALRTTGGRVWAFGQNLFIPERLPEPPWEGGGGGRQRVKGGALPQPPSGAIAAFHKKLTGESYQRCVLRTTGGRVWALHQNLFIP